MRLLRPSVPILLAALALVGACGDSSSGGGTASGGAPSIVVTTNILGDVVAAIVGDEAEVTTVMPVGADPHAFQASARQADGMRKADLLVVNGAGFEDGLDDVIHGAQEDGVVVLEAITAVETLEVGEDAEPGHSGTDPHFFTDPVRMIAAAKAIAAVVVEEIDGIDATVLEERLADYVAALEELDREITATLGPIPTERRVLVTDHEVFGYFADRYDFEVVGTVMPSGTTGEGASAGDLAKLADAIRDEGVRAIFSGESATSKLADALASEVGGDVEVVELYAESLGEAGSDGETYLDMMRTNAERIADALA